MIVTIAMQIVSSLSLRGIQVSLSGLDHEILMHRTMACVNPKNCHGPVSWAKSLAAIQEKSVTIQLSVAVRNARLDAIETTVGTSAVMKIFSGAPPANCAAADSGTVLATLNLPSDYMAAASSGQKVKSGIWEDLLADATGTAGHFRLYATGGTVCGMQGTVTTTGGGGDMEVSNTSFAINQPFDVTTFTLNDNNA